MSLFCKNILLSHGELNFYWWSIMQRLSLLFKLLVKIKRSEVFAIHNNMQKLRFCKLFTERSFRGRKLIKLKICDCKRKPYTSFSLSTSKVLQSRFENVLISFCSFKDNGLKLLDSSSTTFSSYLAVRSVFFWKTVNFSANSIVSACFYKKVFCQSKMGISQKLKVIIVWILRQMS